VTLLEFFAAAARAGIVSSDLGTLAFNCLRRLAAAVAALLRHDKLGSFALPLYLLCLFLFLNGLQKKEKPERVLFDPRHQAFKQFVGFLLVFN
jgi:hypothetical protein